MLDITFLVRKLPVQSYTQRKHKFPFSEECSEKCEINLQPNNKGLIQSA